MLAGGTRNLEPGTAYIKPKTFNFQNHNLKTKITP